MRLGLRASAALFSLASLSFTGCGQAPQMPKEYDPTASKLDSSIALIRGAASAKNPDWVKIAEIAKEAITSLDGLLPQIESRLVAQGELSETFRKHVDANRLSAGDRTTQLKHLSGIIEDLQEPSDDKFGIVEIYDNMRDNMCVDSPGALMSGYSLRGALESLVIAGGSQNRG